MRKSEKLSKISSNWFWVEKSILVKIFQSMDVFMSNRLQLSFIRLFYWSELSGITKSGNIFVFASNRLVTNWIIGPNYWYLANITDLFVYKWKECRLKNETRNPLIISYDGWVHQKVYNIAKRWGDPLILLEGKACHGLHRSSLPLNIIW